MPGTDGLSNGDWILGAHLIEANSERRDDPEWQRLRLFGRGRHPGAFDDGVETVDQL